MKQFLIIQTAFIGDVILATPVIEKLHRHYPEARIDFLLRKGNEGLLQGHPHLNEVIIWDKRNKKYNHLFEVIGRIRQVHYDAVINLQRFSSSGFMTFRARAKRKIGFDKNPFAFCYHEKLRHEIGNGKHEVDRNLELIASLTDDGRERPRLYPSAADVAAASAYQHEDYV
ncbi:MAG: glycosyltransferase family 9 protein, partial [Bacteroidota bacterium]